MYYNFCRYLASRDSAFTTCLTDYCAICYGQPFRPFFSSRIHTLPPRPRPRPKSYLWLWAQILHRNLKKNKEILRHLFNSVSPWPAIWKLRFPISPLSNCQTCILARLAFPNQVLKMLCKVDQLWLKDQPLYLPALENAKNVPNLAFGMPKKFIMFCLAKGCMNVMYSNIIIFHSIHQFPDRVPHFQECRHQNVL